MGTETGETDVPLKKNLYTKIPKRVRKHNINKDNWVNPQSEDKLTPQGYKIKR